MRKWLTALCACALFAGLCRIFPVFSEFFAQRVSIPALTAISKLSAHAAFPILGAFAIIVCAACFIKPRVISAFLALLMLYCVLWLPVESVRADEIRISSAERKRELCVELVDKLSALKAYAAAGDNALDIAGEAMASSARAKAAFFPGWMRALGLAGVYIPFTGEAIIDATRPGAGLIFTAAHELAHAEGIGSEAWASIRAYEACDKFGGAAAYSANLWALKYALNGLDRTDILSALDPDILRDLSDIPWSGDGLSEYAHLADWLCAQRDHNMINR